MSAAMKELSAERALWLTQKICSSDRFEDMLHGSMHELARFFDADTACGFQLSINEGQLWLGLSLTVSMPQQVLCSYNDHYVRLDPICGSAFTSAGRCTIDSNRAKIVRLSDAMNLRDRDHATYYNDFLHKERLDHVLGIMLRSSVPESPIFVLGFQRDGSGRDFDENDVEHAKLLTPPLLSRVDAFALKQMLRNLYWDAHNDTNELLAYDVECDICGNVRIVGSDDRARSHIHGKQTRFFHPALRRSLLQILGTETPASKIGCLISSAGIVGIPETCRVRVTESAHAGETQRLRLTIYPSKSTSILERWAEEHGVTAREVDVVIALARGLKNSEIAASLGLRPRTVENHLRSIFSKVAVTSRTQLLHRIFAREQVESGKAQFSAKI